MRILVVGSGGREHALCWKLAASPLCDKIWCAPGNAGIAAEAECVPIGIEDLDALVTFACENRVDFVVVGPEAPLVAGLVDRLAEAGIPAFGPNAAAAQLEGSKAFMKDVADAAGVPTARWRRFAEPAAAKAFARQLGAPLVVKADGLAAGKGVIIAENLDEADQAIDTMLVDGAFGAAGAEIVIEEFLQGEEASFFALADGTHILPLAAAQDHKRVGDGDTGPNTGGMGAYSPTPIVDAALQARIMAEIIEPTVKAMAARGTPFRGVLFAGVMIDAAGPTLLEFNVRFGDPECQALMARLKSDLLPALIACAEGGLGHFDLRWHDETALVVVMAAHGYPGNYEKGSEIRGLDRAAALDDVLVFHAGTKRDGDRIVANGGRVLGIVGRGGGAATARARAYAGVEAIDWPKGFCRRDIGWRAIAEKAR
ncbi:MAG: phosphoribosylamine--glycine ligase [Dongiaceae bacterium]